MSDHPREDDNASASRRNFLKTTGAVTAGALAGSLLPERAAASSNSADASKTGDPNLPVQRNAV